MMETHHNGGELGWPGGRERKKTKKEELRTRTFLGEILG
jgi:hypothetical protein